MLDILVQSHCSLQLTSLSFKHFHFHIINSKIKYITQQKTKAFLTKYYPNNNCTTYFCKSKIL